MSIGSFMSINIVLKGDLNASLGIYRHLPSCAKECLLRLPKDKSNSFVYSFRDFLMCTLANSEDPNKMPHNAAFHIRVFTVCYV